MAAISAISANADAYTDQLNQLKAAAGDNPAYNAQLDQWEAQLRATQNAGGTASSSAAPATPQPVQAAPTNEDSTAISGLSGVSQKQSTPSVADTASPTAAPAQTATDTSTDTATNAATADTSTPASSSSASGTIPSELQQYASQIQAASQASGVPADRLSAIIWNESRGKADAATTNGGNGLTDGGLMQINQATFAQLQQDHPDLQGQSLSDPGTNIKAGAYLLADEHKKYGDWDLAERAYNSGEGSVDTSNANVTTTGLGDPDYITKISSILQDIQSGTALPA